MRQLTNSQKRRWLVDVVKFLRRVGVDLEPGKWVSYEEGRVTRVCACGLILVALGIPANCDTNDGPAVIRAAARKLGITLAQACSLNNGFEGLGRRDTYAHGANDLGEFQSDAFWYNVGRALRRKYASF